MTAEAVAPTFGGHAAHVMIGGSRYGLPPRCATRRIHGGKHAELVYVLEPDGTLHALIERGEVPIPARLVNALTRRYFPSQGNKIR